MWPLHFRRLLSIEPCVACLVRHGVTTPHWASVERRACLRDARELMYNKQEAHVASWEYTLEQTPFFLMSEHYSGRQLKHAVNLPHRRTAAHQLTAPQEVGGKILRIKTILTPAVRIHSRTRFCQLGSFPTKTLNLNVFGTNLVDTSLFYSELGGDPPRPRSEAMMQVASEQKSALELTRFEASNAQTERNPQLLSRHRRKPVLNFMVVLFYFGVAVAERLARKSPTKANRTQSPAGSPDFRKRESCRTMPLVGGSFSGISRSPRPPPHSGKPVARLTAERKCVAGCQLLPIRSSLPATGMFCAFVFEKRAPRAYRMRANCDLKVGISWSRGRQVRDGERGPWGEWSRPRDAILSLSFRQKPIKSVGSEHRSGYFHLGRTRYYLVQQVLMLCVSLDLIEDVRVERRLEEAWDSEFGGRGAMAQELFETFKECLIDCEQHRCGGFVYSKAEVGESPYFSRHGLRSMSRSPGSNMASVNCTASGSFERIINVYRPDSETKMLYGCQLDGCQLPYCADKKERGTGDVERACRELLHKDGYAMDV
ncbi:hypothetical protein PR048_017426 [Dryococelus australis]|uniref:Uncharacterized protein n=1 Tax=Dryococelus australis TaxID=614101 RepID=A0ABQ9H9H6_9NEOP|nr:hypothetical protein PR048_017426 [Dryococelus australis]